MQARRNPSRRACMETGSQGVTKPRFPQPGGHQSRNRSSSVPRSMARRSLRPHLNQIRTWVRQGRTDAWIAHQLEVTVQQIETFKRENELAPDGASENGDSAPGQDFDDEIDLRAEDDALIAAELEAEQARKAEEAAAAAAKAAEEAAAKAAAGEEPEDDDEADKPARRRGRRGRGRRGKAALEG